VPITYDLKSELLGWVKQTCHNDFMVNGVERIPHGIEIFITETEKYFMTSGVIASESLGDYSVSFVIGQYGLPQHLMLLLNSYRRPGKIL